MRLNRFATHLLYPLARWLRSWADGVLADEQETAELAASPQMVGTLPEASESSSVPDTGPPALWLSRVSSTAPSHWVERVQNAAPDLLRVVESENPEPATKSPPQRPVASVRPTAPLRLGKPRVPVSSVGEAADGLPARGAKPENELVDLSVRVDAADSLPRQQGEKTESVKEPKRNQTKIDDPTKARPLAQASLPAVMEYSARSSTFNVNRPPDVAEPPDERSERKPHHVPRMPQRSDEEISDIRAAATQLPESQLPAPVALQQTPVREKRVAHPLSPQFRPQPAPDQVSLPSAQHPASQSKVSYSRERGGHTTANQRAASDLSPAPASGDKTGAKAMMLEAGRAAFRAEYFRSSALLASNSSAERWPELPEISEISNSEMVSETMRAWTRQRRLEREQTGSIWSE